MNCELESNCKKTWCAEWPKSHFSPMSPGEMMMSNSNKHPSTATAKLAVGGISRRVLMIGLAGVAGTGALTWSLLGSSEPADAQTITVWKSSTCGCCGEWISYMRGKGYRLKVNNVSDPDSIKRGLGVPNSMYSCHTAKIGNYIVEVHVPA